ncbi:type VI secretion system tube protein Hcp [Caballeronia sp. LZ065]|uniref:type VI secretion system tube protein Hcp n=1 Tax=Caballeronia sp. LZ065 TaxID=3038571 RepID=UPI002865C05A|nr:type VI secretion system tube protein Hcp [Caballeronia sp. LZ065]MDR5784235.1 type VI secretion system tube protein Hcp [Caballeronia sp. LZ065]
MSNIFLSIGEVKGESAVIGHVGEIEALSWGWRLTQATRVSSYSEGRKASVDNLSFVPSRQSRVKRAHVHAIEVDRGAKSSVISPKPGRSGGN